MWYDNMARGTDAYNRAIDSGYFMHGAVTVFNGLDGVLFSDQTKKQNANFECGSACGRRVQLHHVVSGFLSKATRFQHGNTDSLLVDAWRLADNILAIDDKADSLFPALNTWKCVAIDARKSVKRGTEGKKAKAEAAASVSADKMPAPIVTEAECNVHVVTQAE
jgi:hypothetical protein